MLGSELIEDNPNSQKPPNSTKSSPLTYNYKGTNKELHSKLVNSMRKRETEREGGRERKKEKEKGKTNKQERGNKININIYR